MSKVTYENLLSFNVVAQNYLRKKKENADTKLGYAISKMAKKVSKLLKPIQELEQDRNEQIENTNIDCCEVDPTSKAIIFDITKDAQGQDVRNYRYTKDNLKKRNQLIRDIAKKFEQDFNVLLEVEVEVENPYYTTEIPADLTEEEKRFFSGIVMTTITAKTNGVAKELQEA